MTIKEAGFMGRYSRRSFVAILAASATCGLLATAAPAMASPADSPTTVSGLPPLPGPQYVDTGGMMTCGGAPQVMAPLFWNPQIVTQADGSEVVEGVAGLNTFGVGCGDSVDVILQTKVCTWYSGCNFDDVASASYTQLPENGYIIFPALVAPVRSGTNRYRLEIEEHTEVWDADDDPGPGAAGFVAEDNLEIQPYGVQLTP
jgi:hypothetical protein